MPRPMPVIVGVPRSGTTLLRMMLDSHRAVAIPPETGFLPALAELNPTANCSRAAWDIISGFETWPDFQLDPGALRATFGRLSPCTPAAAARAFYQSYAGRFGKTQWGDKTPTYGTAMDRIASLLPEAHFVHIIRDGRDVMLSVRGLWFRPGDTVEVCAEDWAARIERTRTLGARVPSYLEIRYESLVTMPEETLREVCRFLDLEFDPSMLAYHVRAGVRLEEHEARYAPDGRLVISKEDRRGNQRFVMEPPRPERIGRWKTELAPPELMRFEAVAGEWLERLGYEVRSRGV
jgi:hypothetical protein